MIVVVAVHKSLELVTGRFAGSATEPFPLVLVEIGYFTAVKLAVKTKCELDEEIDLHLLDSKIRIFDRQNALIDDELVNVSFEQFKMYFFQWRTVGFQPRSNSISFSAVFSSTSGSS